MLCRRSPFRSVRVIHLFVMFVGNIGQRSWLPVEKHMVCFWLNSHMGWPRSGWPLSTTLCYKSVTGLNHHTELLLIFYVVGSDIRKKYWKFHNDTINSFGVRGKGSATFQPYLHVTMSHFKFSYFLNSCPHKIEVLEQLIDFWLHSKYGFI